MKTKKKVKDTISLTKNKKKKRIMKNIRNQVVEGKKTKKIKKLKKLFK